MDTSESPEAALSAAETSGTMTPAQLAEAKEYGRLKLWAELADRALDLAALAIFAFVLALPLDAWLGRWTTSATTRLVEFFLIVTAAHLLVSLPLSYYRGYVLEHRFGLSRQSVGRWFLRYLKFMALAVVFGLAVVVGLYWLIWTVGPLWWIAAAALAFVINIGIGQLLPVLILPLFYKIQRIDDVELAERMARISANTGLSIEGLYRMDLSRETEKVNAMLAGLGRTRRVILGDTLLDKFTLDEIEVILAHEIGHHVHRHIPKMVAIGAVYSLAGFWLCDRILMAWAQRLDPSVSYENMPVYTLPLALLSVTVFSLVLEPLQNAISRRFERQSDRYALLRTGLREAYVTAYHKLAKLNKADPAPHPLEVLLFHSHPPIAERLAIAEP